MIEFQKEAARLAREAVAPPAELKAPLAEMERQLARALSRIAAQSVPIIRAANLARIAALQHTPATARVQIEAAARSFKAFADR